MNFGQYLSEKVWKLDGKRFDSLKAAVSSIRNIERDDDEKINQIAKKLETTRRAVLSVMDKEEVKTNSNKQPSLSYGTELAATSKESIHRLFTSIIDNLNDDLGKNRILYPQVEKNPYGHDELVFRLLTKDIKNAKTHSVNFKVGSFRNEKDDSIIEFRLGKSGDTTRDYKKIKTYGDLIKEIKTYIKSMNKINK